MSSFAYDNFLHDVLSGRISASDVFYVMLVDGTYVPSQASHSKRSDVSGEVVGQGYVAGGKQVVPTLTKNTAGHNEQMVFPPVSWPNSTLAGYRAVYYKRRGGPAASDELVSQTDFGAAQTTEASEFQLDATSMQFNTAVSL